MPNKYVLNITGPDGGTGHGISTSKADDAFKFLERYDVEGSSLSLTVEVDYEDDVYHILEEQAHRETNRG